MKILFIIIDGLGDQPIKELGNKTPLEAARTPNLDFLAKNGICGLIESFRFPKEKVPTSEGSHIGLFGYQNYFLGRGPYEAAGIGMKMKQGDVALRVNFGTVNNTFKVIDRRAGRIKKTQSLVRDLKGIEINGIKFLIKESYGHRAGLILRGKNLSAKISDGDPHKTGIKVKKIIPLDKSSEALFTARVLDKFLKKSHQILKNHPLNKKRKREGKLSANYLLVRGAGKFRPNPSFKERYGLKSCCVAAGALYKGIAKILGMDLIKVKGATGFANTNILGKFRASKKALKKYNFVFCHIKATDTFSHDGDYLGKKKFIEKIDKKLPLLFELKNTLIVITADHSTPCKLKDHSRDPLPVLVYGRGSDNVEKFSEKECSKGKLGKIKSIDFFKKVIRIKKGN